MTTLADAMIRAQVMSEGQHPDVLRRRNVVKRWRKAIRWCAKQSGQVLVDIVFGKYPSVPGYLDARTVHMVADAFTFNRRPHFASSGLPKLWKNVVEPALRAWDDETKALIYKALNDAFTEWMRVRVEVQDEAQASTEEDERSRPHAVRPDEERGDTREG